FFQYSEQLCSTHSVPTGDFENGTEPRQPEPGQPKRRQPGQRAAEEPGRPARPEPAAPGRAGWPGPGFLQAAVQPGWPGPDRPGRLVEPERPRPAARLALGRRAQRLAVGPAGRP